MQAKTTILLENGDRPFFTAQYHGTLSTVWVSQGSRDDGFRLIIPLAHLPRWIAELQRCHKALRDEIEIREAVKAKKEKSDDGDLP